MLENKILRGPHSIVISQYLSIKEEKSPVVTKMTMALSNLAEHKPLVLHLCQKANLDPRHVARITSRSWPTPAHEKWAALADNIRKCICEPNAGVGVLSQI